MCNCHFGPAREIVHGASLTLDLEQVGVGKNIGSSVHCNIFFYIWIDKILWMDSDKQWLPITRCSSVDASRSPPPAARSALPATSLEGRRVMSRGNTVGAAEAGSRCLTHRSFRDCKLPVQPVSPWLLHRAPAGSTLLCGETRVQCQHVNPSHLARRLCLCLYQTKMYHAVPETMALSHLNYGCTIL